MPLHCHYNLSEFFQLLKLIDCADTVTLYDVIVD